MESKTLKEICEKHLKKYRLDLALARSREARYSNPVDCDTEACKYYSTMVEKYEEAIRALDDLEQELIVADVKERLSAHLDKESAATVKKFFDKLDDETGVEMTYTGRKNDDCHDYKIVATSRKTFNGKQNPTSYVVTVLSGVSSNRAIEIYNELMATVDHEAMLYTLERLDQ